MSNKNQPSLERMFSQTRADLMEFLTRHGLLHFQADTVMREITSRMQHNDIDARFDAESSSHKLSLMNEMTRKLHVVDEKLKLLASEHNTLFDAVVAFNTLVLNSPQNVQHHFIQFDEVMSKIFADQYERYSRPYPERKHPSRPLGQIGRY